jgi:hypothetical protein
MVALFSFGLSYCNVDDKALLGNDSVKQQWKRSDRCYAMARYTDVNNGGEDVTAEKSASLVRATMKLKEK